MRPWQFLLAVVAFALASAAWRLHAEDQSAAGRRQAIAECEAHGGLPVVLAGPLSSRGIGCAAPLGD